MQQINKIIELAEAISNNTNYEISVNLETHIKAIHVFAMKKGSFKTLETMSGGTFSPFTYYGGTGCTEVEAKNGLNKVIERLQTFLETNK